MSTGGSCTLNGATKQLNVDCSVVKQSFQDKCVCGSSGGASPKSIGDDPCDALPNVFDQCIIGSGPAGVGAALAAEKLGKAKNTLIVEKGLDAAHFERRIRSSTGDDSICFPNEPISSSGTWPYDNVTKPWHVRYPANPSIWFPYSDSNMFGGNFPLNGGAFFTNNISWKHGDAGHYKQNLQEIITAIGIGDTPCPEGSQCRKVLERLSAADDVSAAVADLVDVSEISSTWTFSSDYPNGKTDCSSRPRIDFQNVLLEKTQVQFQTGKEVHSMKTRNSKTELLDSEDNVISTCGKVVMAGGAINTPALLLRSPELELGSTVNRSNIGKGLTNHYGMFVLSFCPAPFDHVRDRTAFLQFTSKNGQSHAGVWMAQPSQDGADTIAYVIVYGGAEPERDSEGGYVSVDPTTGATVHSGDFVPSEDIKQDYLDVLNATMISLDATFGAPCTYMFSDGTDPIEVGNVRMLGTKEHVLPYYLSLLPQRSVGLYHEFASMYDAVNRTTGAISDDIIVTDASASHGFAGSPASYLMTKSYTQTLEFFSA